MKHARPVEFDGRSHGRTPNVLLRLDERDALIRTAATFYPGASDREIARQLHAALSRYYSGRFRRDRNDTCPVEHRGKLTEVLYLLLRTHDHVPSIGTIRCWG